MTLFLLGCLDHTPIPGGEGESFVAMQSHFSDYQSWDAIEVETGDTGHTSGSRTVYLNAAPPEGSESFPVGTILLKTIVYDGGMDIHARAKRGGGFNADGAPGWEWFELILSDGVPVIKWRGETAPSGEVYQSLPGSTDSADTITGDCNTCHHAAANNDFVFSVGL